MSSQSTATAHSPRLGAATRAERGRGAKGAHLSPSKNDRGKLRRLDRRRSSHSRAGRPLGGPLPGIFSSHRSCMGSATPTPPTSRSGVRDARACPRLPVLYGRGVYADRVWRWQGERGEGDAPRRQMNGEIANHLRGHGHHADRGPAVTSGSNWSNNPRSHPAGGRRPGTTALSGYQAAKWDGVQNATALRSSRAVRAGLAHQQSDAEVTTPAPYGLVQAEPSGTSSWAKILSPASSPPTTHRPSRPGLNLPPHKPKGADSGPVPEHAG